MIIKDSYGSITRIEVLDPGEGYFNGTLSLSVTESNGTGALFRPVVGTGRITIKATLDSYASFLSLINISEPTRPY